MPSSAPFVFFKPIVTSSFLALSASARPSSPTRSDTSPAAPADPVLATSADKALKSLRQARLTNSYEAELRKLISVDLLILDDFCLDAMDQQESRDIYEILSERQRAGSVIVTSNRGPDEWLAAFADPMRAQSAIDRFVNAAYDLVIEGESYRPRLKPTRARATAHATV